MDRALTATPDTSGTAKQEILIDFHEFFGPEVLLVEYVSCVYLRCDAAGEILDPLAAIAAFDSGVVAVGFGIGLLEERKPCLVRVFTLGKILSSEDQYPTTKSSVKQSSKWSAYQGAAVGLVYLAVRLLRVYPLSVFPYNTLQAPLVIIRFRKI